MSTKRTGEPWMPPDEYGRSLPQFTVNLVVTNIERALGFYRNVMGAKVVYSDADFAALRLENWEFMIHADHAYDRHPWHERLGRGDKRGLGAELRLLGTDPDLVESRAKQHGAKILQTAQDKPHGWRDVIVEDHDGYAWAVGVATPR